jgi:predicted site-specific integrase-resolvase
MSCMLEPLLEPTKVARLLGVEVETLGAWRRRGYGPRWYRIGKKIRYAEPDLRAWMNAQAGSCATVGQAEGDRER